MHVLGHGFGQKRKTSFKRPRDLHIRKVSFSGCSLSSGCSIDSASTSSTFTQSRVLMMPDSAATSVHSASPRSLHGAAPPRLYERPFIKTDKQRYEEAATFFDDEDDSAVSSADEEDVRSRSESIEEEMETPQDNDDGAVKHASTTSINEQAKVQQQEPDYFAMQFTTASKRPPMPGSHWSESTIQTLDMSMTPGGVSSHWDETPISTARQSSILDDNDDDDDSDDDDYDDENVIEHGEGDDVPRVMLSVPSFYYSKRATVPKRPPMKNGDSVENFIKRGGWKRRGIVFQKDDVDGTSNSSNSSDEEGEEEDMVRPQYHSGLVMSGDRFAGRSVFASSI